MSTMIAIVFTALTQIDLEFSSLLVRKSFVYFELKELRAQCRCGLRSLRGRQRQAVERKRGERRPSMSTRIIIILFIALTHI